jgi:hypothetical protein
MLSFYRITSILSLVTLAHSIAFSDVCAEKYSDLDATESLKKLKTLLIPNNTNGFVNMTKGSYFYITATDSEFQILFFTTGLFDLYGIRRDGPLVFCDTEKGLTAIGLKRTQNIFIEDNKLQFGDRSAKESFQPGPMPEKLAKINKIEIQKIALQPDQ